MLKRKIMMPTFKVVKLEETKHHFIVVASYFCAIGTNNSLPNSCMFGRRVKVHSLDQYALNEIK